MDGTSCWMSLSIGDDEPEYSEDALLLDRDLLQAQIPVMNRDWDNEIDDEVWTHF